MPCIHLLDGSCPGGSSQRNDCAGIDPDLCDEYTSQYRKPGSNIKQCLFPGLNNLMARQAACTKAHPELWAEAGGELCSNCKGYNPDEYDMTDYPRCRVKGTPKSQVMPHDQKLRPLPVDPADLEIPMVCTGARAVHANGTNGCGN